MDEHSLEVLELDKILQKIENYAATELGVEIINRLRPVAELEYIRERLREVTAGRNILDNYGPPPLGGISDLRAILKKAEKGMVLNSGEIMSVRKALGAFAALKNYLQQIVEENDPRIVERRYAVVTDLGQEISPLKDLKKEIDRVFDDYGEIKDSASSRLRSLRKSIRNHEDKIRDKLEGIIRGKKYQSMLQDNLVTRREGRYVVPVKQEHRNSFSGIVHDQSSSGMTIFMEPMAVVKLNNRLRELKSEEEREIHRLLQEITVRIEQYIPAIKNGLQKASILDVIFARAGYSSEINGCAPVLNEEGRIEIKQGRHPLLQNEPVPIDVEVGDGFRTLVITGPNTGGKTVALKTIGLFVLMVQTGLHIPAEAGSNISIFNRVYADIGDEQSIEQNLSTFSSHMNKIRKYLKNADNTSLILLDELGAGTDPREGAALGISILERLKKRNAVTVATTHYSQLKSYAYSQKGVQNASVEFDIETLRPTYNFNMGIPGGSNAFAIALKLGLPEDLISQARSLLSDEELKVEDIIDDLNRERKKYRQLRREMERENKEAEKLRNEYNAKLEQIEERKEKIIREARQEAKEMLRRVKQETRRLVKELKEKDYSRPQIDRKATDVNEKIKSLTAALSHNTDDEEQDVDKDIEVGDRVRIKSVGRKGEVIEIDKEKNEARIQAGVMKVTAGLEELVPVELPDNRKKEMIKKYRVNKSQKVKPKIDLRGERYEEAQYELKKYLDDAFLAGYNSVEIIHGKGTGALREAVQEVLEENPHVPEFRSGKREEGGRGVTIASLKR